MKRSRDMILSQILDICGRGALKTHIAYRANLNSNTATRYIDLLIANGLINKKNGQNIVYETTPRGQGLLVSFKKIQNELSD